MAWSGGNYTKGNNATGGWVGAASLGIGIEAGSHDTQDNDFATGINQCLNKDGSNAATGNLNLGGNKLTNIGAATARTDAVQTAQVQDSSPLWGGTSGGTSTAYTITLSPAITAYATGQTFRWIANATVTGAATINVNSVGAKTLQRQGTALVGNEFKTGDIVEMVYDGTQFQITNIASAPIYVDRTNGRVGIGTTAPTSALTTIGNSLLAPNISNTAADTYYEARVTGTADGSPNSIRVGVDGASLNGVAYIDARNVGVAAVTPLTFRISGTERMRIHSNGYVGIGVTNPSSFVQMRNTVGALVNTCTIISDVAGDVGTAGLVIVKKDNNTTTSQSLVQFLTNGAATGQGQINGNGASQAAFGSYSDERLKENIQNIPSQLANIFALRPVEFDYKDGSGHQIGFIAQEVQEIYPDLIGQGQDGFLTLSGLGKNEARMIKAFQEFAQLTQAKVESLEARVAELEAA